MPPRARNIEITAGSDLINNRLKSGACTPCPVPVFFEDFGNKIHLFRGNNMESLCSVVPKVFNRTDRRRRYLMSAISPRRQTLRVGRKRCLEDV